MPANPGLDSGRRQLGLVGSADAGGVITPDDACEQESHGQQHFGPGLEGYVEAVDGRRGPDCRGWQLDRPARVWAVVFAARVDGTAGPGALPICSPA